MSSPIHGRHIVLELLLNGAPQNVGPQATDMTARARFDSVETKHLGDNATYIEHIQNGWEGTITFAQRTAALDQFIDGVQAAKAANLPAICNIVETITYRDGSQARYLYPQVEVQWERTARRSSAVEVRLQWVCGVNRVKL